MPYWGVLPLCAWRNMSERTHVCTKWYLWTAHTLGKAKSNPHYSGSCEAACASPCAPCEHLCSPKHLAAPK